MRTRFELACLIAMLTCSAAVGRAGETAGCVPLPQGVKAVWDLEHACREKSLARERVCLNGLWRWQPDTAKADTVPDGGWGYFKVPGPWPGNGDYIAKDCQSVFAHPSWSNANLGVITSAWYQREITIPDGWAGRRIVVAAEYVNSYAEVFVDGVKAGEIRFLSGEVDLTAVCRPGGRYVLSLLVVAMPLKAVMLSYNDTASAREVKGSVGRRGLCGDVWLASTPPGARLDDVKVGTSTRQWAITLDAALHGCVPGAAYTLRAEIRDGDRIVTNFTSKPFKAANLPDGRMAFTVPWKTKKLWDLHTPQNVYQVQLTLLDADGKALDIALPVRFGFREFWIEGRDLFLNGSRIFLSAVPLDNGYAGAAWASYAGARESLLRLQSFGINFVYTHNYDCQPGAHLSFAEILRAADDVGMLVSFSQPHFSNYDWDAPDAERANGYARHAEFYVRVAQNHPSVVCYSMSHNAGYAEDMNPDMIDGLADPRPAYQIATARHALQAEAIVRRLDPSRIVYHHACGNLGSMHTSNFYPNFTPIQELSDWFEHWATRGVKPAFTCEYGAPFSWDWTMYRGWYKGQRVWGSAKVPWEFCLAEWNAQFLGDRAFQIGEFEKENLRWEAKQFRAGNLWHRWDYPHQVGSAGFADQYAVLAMYVTDNWRAYRTWGLSANSPWECNYWWELRAGVIRNVLTPLPVDWENLQRPGFSPDYLQGRPDRMHLAYERSDWVATPVSQALIRNNRPLLAYLGGKPAGFTEKGHNFRAGETVEKQVIVINNSRVPVTCDCAWTFNHAPGTKRVTLPTGQQERIPLRFDLPASLAPGAYEIGLAAAFSTGEVQKDAFTIHVLPAAQPPAKPAAKIAVFDPKGETWSLLKEGQRVEAGADLSAYDILIIGKEALTVSGAGPDLRRVPEGLKVVVFEQTAEALEQRLGFRVAAYGLRNVTMRVPDHPLLAGIGPEHLRDWRGEATLLAPRLTYELSQHYKGAPTVKWCDLEVTRGFRCGCRGNVASVLIEKPARGDFLPIVDGGYSLQYSPLLEYREGKGRVLFCQMDVTGRTETDPAAETIARNILRYAAAWKPEPIRNAFYLGDPAGQRHLEAAGFHLGAYASGQLTPDDVLVVGPGAQPAAEVGAWVKAGGHVLAIGLDETAANAFLPTTIGMRSAEYINSAVEPAGVRSLLAGVGPADVYNRDPLVLPLIGGSALVQAPNANMVLCQLVPWQCDYAKQFNVKRTYRRTSFAVTRVLSNLGVASSTPLLDRFHTPVASSRPEKRCLDGFYLDAPEEMDDPYRFFRW